MTGIHYRLGKRLRKKDSEKSVVPTTLLVGIMALIVVSFCGTLYSFRQTLSNNDSRQVLSEAGNSYAQYDANDQWKDDRLSFIVDYLTEKMELHTQPLPQTVTPGADPTIVSPQSLKPTPSPVKVTPVTGLRTPALKDKAMQLVSSAENSSLNWKAQYGYLEDIGDGRGYTGGIVGFCSGTDDMLELVRYYTTLKPSNGLTPFIPSLQKVNGSASHSGLGASFEVAWKAAASDPVFRQAQDHERDRVYFDPAVAQAQADGLGSLGQFIYYDALVVHGPGNDDVSFGGIRMAALKKANSPAQGGKEADYLNAFLDARVAAMKTEAAHDDVSRVETAQRTFVKAGNLDLTGPLVWQVYGDTYRIQ